MCWVYIALYAPGFVTASYLDQFPAFLLVVGLALSSPAGPSPPRAVLGAGFMAKVFPLALVPVAIKVARADGGSTPHSCSSS